MRQLKLPKIWKRALVVAIPKPNNSWPYPNSYGPTSLLDIFYKILERLIYVASNQYVDPLLPRKQAGLPCKKSIVNQIIFLIQEIKNSG